MDKLGKLDLGGVAALGITCAVLLAGWIVVSAEVNALHEAKPAKESVVLTTDGRMKVTVTAKAADAAAPRSTNTATASTSAGLGGVTPAPRT